MEKSSVVVETPPQDLEIEAKRVSRKALETIAVATAMEVGFKVTLKRARRSLLLKRQKCGMKEIASLNKQKKRLLEQATDINEYRKGISRIEEKREQILGTMEKKTEKEQQQVNKVRDVVQYFSEEKIEAIKAAGLYREFTEVPPEVEARVYQLESENSGEVGKATEAAPEPEKKEGQ